MSAIVVTAEQERLHVRDIVERLGKLLAPEETKKVKRGEISRMTGIPARRLQDFARGVINEPASHQVRTLENALAVAREMARESADQIEDRGIERAEIRRILAGPPPRLARIKGASRTNAGWARAVGTGPNDRGMGED